MQSSDVKVATVFTRVSIVIVALSILCGAILTSLLAPEEAQAIPAFARKYDMNCMDCHTAPPILNTFGQRFLENGYQLPGTEDGGITGKKKLGDLNLDDVNQYVGFRLVGNALRSWSFKKQNPPGADAGVVENKTEFTFPRNFVLFTGGTVAKNIGFMVELGHDVEGGGAEVERGFVTFNNLGSHNLAHLRVGKFDPNAFSSYATVRQAVGRCRGKPEERLCAAAFFSLSVHLTGWASRPAPSPPNSMASTIGRATICPPSPPRSITQGTKPASMFMGVRSATGSCIRLGC